MTKAEQETYNRRLKIQRDNYAADKYARETAIAEGRAEGRAKGLAEGEAAKAETVARKLLQRGFDKQEIAEITGLAGEDVEALR